MGRRDDSSLLLNSGFLLPELLLSAVSCLRDADKLALEVRAGSAFKNGLFIVIQVRLRSEGGDTDSTPQLGRCWVGWR